MAHIKTSKGYLEYKSHLLNFGKKVLKPEPMLENIRILALYMDKIDINWGPAFGTLIGIVRNEDFQPWKPVFDVYILKEDEERFKDIVPHNFRSVGDIESMHEFEFVFISGSEKR